MVPHDVNNRWEVPIFTIEIPEKRDGREVYDFITSCPPLDVNSRYAYFLLCDHFSQTSVVCRDDDQDGKIVGFIGGYRLPDAPGTFFVWQIAVAEQCRGHKLSHRMLDHLLHLDRDNPVTRIQATYTPSNMASLNFFKKYAARKNALVTVEDYLSEEDFDGIETGHEAELTISILLTRTQNKEPKAEQTMRIFEDYESQVRGYVRAFPAVFDKAEGALLFDEHNNRYIDFFAGAGTLNYGHNHPLITEAMIKYLQDGRIVHGLDKATCAKRDFMQTFVSTILEPRNMEYKIQFTGPTGTNAVETAMKLARLVKKRSNILAFTNGYHGLTMGSMSVTGNSFYRDESYGVRANTDFMPFDGYLGEEIDTIEYMRKMLSDPSSGVDHPAAVIVETIQGEGGINVASVEWLQRLEKLCRDFDILLIVDDIQMGNGRTGTFFSFEEAGIRPDIITLSKSLGGGLPMSILLMRPELDQWQPGEHTGTFRGNNLAFVAATEALKLWQDDRLGNQVLEYGDRIKATLEEIIQEHPDLNLSIRGRGMAWGLDFGAPELAAKVSSIAFEKGLIIETAGADASILKFLPPLIIDPDLLSEGLTIVKEAIQEFCKENTTVVYQEAS